MSDVLITPANGKIEFFDSSSNLDAKIELDAFGNLNITNPGGDISIGDTSADIFIGDGASSVDIRFEQVGTITGQSGVTVTLGESGSGIQMGTALNLNSNDVTNGGRFTSTKANSTSTGGGQIYLNGATGNRIDWNTNGVAAPAFGTRSAGTKLVLYPNIGASSADFALGIESSTLWYSVPTTSNTHRWYGGTTSWMTLTSAGLAVTSDITIGDSIIHSGDTNTKIRFPAADTFTVETSGAERMRIDSSGNFGIGTTSPAALFEVRKDQNTITSIKVTNSNTGSLAQARIDQATGTANSYSIINLQDNSGSPYWQFAVGPAIIGTYYDSAIHVWRNVAGAERMRINSSGNLMIGGTTDFGRVTITANTRNTTSEGGPHAVLVTTGASGQSLWMGYDGISDFAYINSAKTGSVKPIMISSRGGGAAVNATSLGGYSFYVSGSIGSTGEITAYASDMRLKTDITPISNAVDRVMLLNGVCFKWKDITRDLGFDPERETDVGVLAQEVQRVLPEAVSLAPFDRNDDRTSRSGENYLTVHYEKLTALLIEAVKEQQRQINELRLMIRS